MSVLFEPIGCLLICRILKVQAFHLLSQPIASLVRSQLSHLTFQSHFVEMMVSKWRLSFGQSTDPSQGLLFFFCISFHFQTISPTLRYDGCHICTRVAFSKLIHILVELSATQPSFSKKKLRVNTVKLKVSRVQLSALSCTQSVQRSEAVMP